ncbi:MAG: MerR family transcriptional regulator [Kutzneria sp.]|nr:MerR family transcriptional regulator [Kutzneria sp.]
MTATVRRLRDLMASLPAQELPPLPEELVCSLEVSIAPDARLSIAEVAELTGVSAHALRYYERIGLVEVGRDSAGHRQYDRDALARVVFVTRLRLSDMPIQAITRYVELVRQGPATEPERLALLRSHRAAVLRRLQDLRTALAVIDYKIATYGGACAP